MNEYPTSAIPPKTWQEIDFIFRRHEIIQGFSGDGFIPENITTNKYGIEIIGKIALMNIHSYLEHRITLHFARPNFSSIESLTPKKLRNVEIIAAKFEGNMLYVSVA